MLDGLQLRRAVRPRPHERFSSPIASINLSQRAKSSAGKVPDKSGEVTVPPTVFEVDCEAGATPVGCCDAVWMGGPKLAWVVPTVTAIFVETERPFLASVYPIWLPDSTTLSCCTASAPDLHPAREI